MWVIMCEWIKVGGVIEDSWVLEMDLIGLFYSFDNNNVIVLEKKFDMKKCGVLFLDEGDVLVLIFVYFVVVWLIVM